MHRQCNAGGRPLERSYQKTEVFSHQTMVFWHQPRNFGCQKTLPKAGLRPSHGEVGVRWVANFLKKSTNINKNMSTPSRVGELPWSLPSKRGRAAGIRVCKLGSLAYGLDVRTNFWHQPPDFWCFLLSTLWFWHQPWSFAIKQVWDWSISLNKRSRREAGPKSGGGSGLVRRQNRNVRAFLFRRRRRSGRRAVKRPPLIQPPHDGGPVNGKAHFNPDIAWKKYIGSDRNEARLESG